MQDFDPQFQAALSDFMKTFPVPADLPPALSPALDRWALASFVAHRALISEVEAERKAMERQSDKDAQSFWKQLRNMRLLANRDAAAMERAFFDSLKRYGSLEKLLIEQTEKQIQEASRQPENDYELEYTPKLAEEAQAFLKRQDPGFLNDPANRQGIDRIRRAIAVAQGKAQPTQPQRRGS